MSKKHTLVFLVIIFSLTLSTKAFATITISATGVQIGGSVSGYTLIQAAASPNNYTLTLPSNAGTNGQVLTTNGSGGLSWSTVGGGGLTLTPGAVGFTIAGGTSSKTLTIGGNFTTAHGDDLTLVTTGSTSLTLPTSGTLQTTTGSPSGFVIPSQASGDILYASSASAWSRLGKGSDGTVLTLASGVPTWAAASGGVTSITGTANEITVTGSTTPTLSFSGGHTGTGAVVLATSPTLVTPTLGAATATSLTLPAELSTTSSTGIIFAGTHPFINYYGDSTSIGHNTIIGIDAGNFTMGPGGRTSDIGSMNTVIGAQAFQNNTQGEGNIAIGYQALQANLDGSGNNAVGSYNSMHNTSGGTNYSFGDHDLQTNTTGSSNEAIGYAVMQNGATPHNNVGIGNSVLQANTGTYNIGIGDAALMVATGDFNIAIGGNSMVSTVGGTQNVAVGIEALKPNISGNYNVAMGWMAGETATAGNANTSGSNNTWVGYQTGPSTSSQLSNASAFGNGALNSKSNQVVLGNSSVTETVINGNMVMGSNLAISPTAPTVSSGFGSSPSFATGSTALAFDLNVGTGGSAQNGVLTLPTAAHGWVCHVSDITTPASFITSQTAYTTASASFQNYSRTTGSATAWTASDHLIGSCVAF